MKLTETAHRGAKHMEKWLNENGFTGIEMDSWQKGSIDIRAKGKLENILVQVKTVQLPDENSPLNGTDKFALKDLASRQQRIPYSALISIDEDNNLVGEIIWERVH